MRLKRPLLGPTHAGGPSRGRDVVAIKRGLSKVEENFFPKPPGGFDDVYNRKTVDAVKTFQRINDLPVSGNFGQGALDALWPYMDAYARWLYRTYSPPKPKSEQDLAFERLLAAMVELDAHTPGYKLGGGHGIPLSEVSAYQKLDCSSSTSKALYEAGLFFDGEYAIVSGQFENWGAAGTGSYFTIYANAEHVWIRLHKSRWWRFDTSPHGDGGRGPKLRLLPRFTSGFVARHYPGM